MFRNVFNRGARAKSTETRTTGERSHPTPPEEVAVRRRASRAALRQAAFETLEERQLFSVFGDLATSVNATLAGVDNAIGQIDAVQNKLPLVNKRLVEVEDIRDSVKSFKDQIVGALNTLDDAATKPDQLKQAIYDALKNVPGVGNLVGDTNGNGPGVDDITVDPTYDPTKGNVKVTLDLVKQTTVADQSFAFGTGLDALPLRVDAAGSVSLGVGFAWNDFTFGVSNFKPSVDFNAPNDLTFTLEGSINPDPITNNPATLKGYLGFLALSATDIHAGPELTGTLALDVTNGVGGVSVKPTLEAAAHIDLGLKAEFAANGSVSMPSIETDFDFDWVFAQTDPRSGAINFGNAPEVHFNNVRLNLGEFIDNLAGPIIDAIHEVTEPMQPIVDVLTYELPVLTDVAEFFGGEPVTLMTLADYAKNIDDLPPDVKTYITLAQEIVEIVDTVNSIQDGTVAGGQSLSAAGDIDTYWVDFGDFDLNNATNGDVRAAAAALLMTTDFSDPAAVEKLIESKDWSALIPHDLTGKMLDNIKGEISSALGEVGDAVNSVIDHFAEPAKGNQTFADITFPLFDNPSQGIFQLLLGHDVDIVALDAGANIDATNSVGFDMYGFDVQFASGVNVDAGIHLAYDTFGLRQLADAVLDGDPSTEFDPTLIADGLYVKSDAKIDVGGKIEAKFGIDYPLFDVYVDGGVTFGLHLAMDDTLADDIDHDTSKIRLFRELGTNIFQASGQVGGYLAFTARVGVEILGEFIGISHTFNIANGTIIEFATGGTGIANPFKKPDPVALGTFNSKTGLLTLNTGANAALRKVSSGDQNENYTITHLAGEAGDETVLLSAFGVTEKFQHVKKIVGDFGTNDDTVIVGQGVVSPLEIHGGEGADKLMHNGSGDAHLWGDGGNDALQGGDGNNILEGGAGDDQIAGGGGTSTANTLIGDAGNDLLVGGDSQNVLMGGVDNDTLQAGPNGDYMNGSGGDDVFVNGPGVDTMVGDRGNDTMNWAPGDNNDVFQGDGDYDSLGVAGSQFANVFSVSRSGNDVVIAAPGGATLVLKPDNGGTEEIAIAGLAGSDTIDINDLSGSFVKHVGVNLGDLASPDGVKDTVRVYGTAGADLLTIDTELGIMQKDSSHLFGGVTRVAGMNSYVVHAVNVSDALYVKTLDGEDEVDLTGVTGPTFLETGGNDDSLDVLPSILPSAKNPNGFLGSLSVDAGAGNNALRVIENTSVDESATITSSSFKSMLLPNGLEYQATGGSYASALSFTTGNGADKVFVKSTVPGVTTTVRTVGSNDQVVVSSDGSPYGNLASVQGSLIVDGGAGTNGLTLVDRAASLGNGNVVVTGTQVLNFAGPGDNVPVTYQSLGGTMALTLEGSDVATVAEGFRLDMPGQAVAINSNGGSDAVTVRGLAQPATLDLGNGADSVIVASAANSLDTLQAALTVNGGEGADSVTAVDAGSVAGRTYTLGASSLTRSGAAAIAFSGVEDLAVKATNFTDGIVAGAVPAGATVSFDASAGNDFMSGPNKENLWEVTEQNGGRLNTSVRFASVENLNGGTAGDRFAFSSGKGVSGNVIGDSGTDQLDYSNWNTGITVNMPTSKATAVGGLAQLVENITGGQGDDLLIGNALPNVIVGRNGNDILVGNDGTDSLNGQDGRDLIIGGTGADALQGGSGEDLLIDGKTAYDADPVALAALRSEWKRTDVGYTTRISHLRTGGPATLNGVYKLVANVTVFSDASVDNLMGQSDTDWLWGKLSNPADTFNGWVSTEVIN